MNTLLKPIAAALALATALSAGAALAQSALEISFADPEWTGETIPAGQHCALQDGNGASPALTVAGLPDGVTTIHVAFNDESFEPMNNGGHGVLGFEVTPSEGSVTLPSVPGGTLDLPAGVFIAEENRTAGDFLTEGYMPPCSGGAGNTYSANITALDAGGAVLGEGYIVMGVY